MVKEERIVEKIPNHKMLPLIEPLRVLLKNGFDYSNRIIFLCGAAKDSKDSLRRKFADIISIEKNLILSYPEDLFEDLLEGQGSNSLLSLETQLANAVDLIVMIPESPGSFAELGAFSVDADLAKKMLVFRPGEFKSKKSFINHGPIRLVRSHGGRIYDLPKEMNFDDANHVQLVMDKIKSMLPSRRGGIKRDFDNMLFYSKYILMLVYLFDRLSLISIYKLMEKIMGKKSTRDNNIACKAAVQSLVRSEQVNIQDKVYVITTDGYDALLKSVHMKNALNELRAKIINIQCSRH